VNNELLVQVDEQDRVIGSVDRRIAHLNQGILHRGLIVVVTNDENKILLTQRAKARPDLSFPPPFPGFWDITIAGHPKWGQSDYVTQMVNELKEELGIETKSNEVNYLGKFQYPALHTHKKHKTNELSRFLVGKSSTADFTEPAPKLARQDSRELRVKILALATSQSKQLGIAKSTLHYLRRNAEGARSFRTYSKTQKKINHLS
jgi:isopentenyl-diphosphate delta-isomerase type 1